MKRETLVELGLTKEQVDSVMGEYGKSLNDVKERLTAAEGERDQFKNQFEDQQSELEKTFTDKSKEFGIHHALKNAGTLDESLVNGLLDREKITIDGNDINGLTEQLEALRESKGFLFEPNKPSGTLEGFKTIPNTLKDPGAAEPKSAFDAVKEKYTNH